MSFKESACIACGRCNVCPTGVDIKTCLTLFDGSLKDNDKVAYRSKYNNMIKFMRAHNCMACGRCEKVCPEHINIIEKLKEVTLYFKDEIDQS